MDKNNTNLTDRTANNFTSNTTNNVNNVLLQTAKVTARDLNDLIQEVNGLMLKNICKKS